jgi:hypothetical protein
MRAPAPKPNSVLADAITTFVQYKRALNRKYRSEALALGLFDRYLQQQQITARETIDGVVVERFLASRSRPRPRSYNHLRGVLARFFDWAVLHRVIERNPVSARPRRETKQRIPYLFDLNDARRLLELARTLPDLDVPSSMKRSSHCSTDLGCVWARSPGSSSGMSTSPATRCSFAKPNSTRIESFPSVQDSRNGCTTMWNNATAIPGARIRRYSPSPGVAACTKARSVRPFMPSCPSCNCASRLACRIPPSIA